LQRPQRNGQPHLLVSFWICVVSCLFLGTILFSGFSFWPEFLNNIRNPLLIASALAAPLFFLKSSRDWARTFFVTPAHSMTASAGNRWAIALFGIYLFVFCKVSWLNYASFNVHAIDFSIYNQLIAYTARGKFMYSPACGGCNHFGVHPTWVLFLIYPLHRLFDSPLFSLLLHPLLLWAAAIPLDLLASKWVVSPIHKIIILFCYFNFWAVSRILMYDYHIEVFYVVLFLWLYFGYATGRNWLIWLTSLIFISVKTDAPVYMMAFGFSAIFFPKYFLRSGCRFDRRQGALLALLCFAVFILNIQIVIPSNSSQGAVPSYLGYWAKYGSTIREIAYGALLNWSDIAKDIFRGGWISATLPFLFFPLASPATALPSLVFVVLHSASINPVVKGLAIYYSAPLIGPLFAGYLDILGRLAKWRSHAVFFTLVFTSFVGSGYLKFHRIHPNFFAFKEFTAGLDPQSTYCIQGILMPHFDYLDDMHLLNASCLDRNPKYIFYNSSLSRFPLSEVEFADLIERVDKMPALERKQLNSFQLVVNESRN